MDMGNPKEVRDEFDKLMVASEMGTPSELDSRGRAGIGKFAANARRLRQGEITPQEFEQIMSEDD
ncbi:hypothetical protein [Micromonospora sp. NPDC023737]|uniref:hypothetical protein n=1 Tax=unclassified Micromonospora TaxID=2617518 RepID=UPI0033EA4F85